MEKSVTSTVRAQKSHVRIFSFVRKVLRLGGGGGSKAQGLSHWPGGARRGKTRAPSLARLAEPPHPPVLVFKKNPYGRSVVHTAGQCCLARRDRRSDTGQGWQGAHLQVLLHLASEGSVPACVGHFGMAVVWGLGTGLGGLGKVTPCELISAKLAPLSSA